MWTMSTTTAASTRAPGAGRPLRLLKDERLAHLAAAGNERAFALLYERHHQTLYRYCRSIVRHEQDAQDALQATLTKALVALAKGAPDAPMRPWLFRIAHNESVTLLRRRTATADLDQAGGVAAPGIEDRVEERRRLATLVADLHELPERQRAALVMRELSGLSHVEIAAALQISVSGAKQSIFEARAGLQECERGRAMECTDVQQLISDADGRSLRARPVRAHLRGCAPCRELRDAIATRREDLAALAPPLPAAAAAGLLSKLLGGGHGGGGSGGLAATAAAKVSGATLAGKVAAAAAVLATAGAGAAAPALVGRHTATPVRVQPVVARAAAPRTPTATTHTAARSMRSHAVHAPHETSSPLPAAHRGGRATPTAVASPGRAARTLGPTRRPIAHGPPTQAPSRPISRPAPAHARPVTPSAPQPRPAAQPLGRPASAPAPATTSQQAAATAPSAPAAASTTAAVPPPGAAIAPAPAATPGVDHPSNGAVVHP